MNNCPDDDSLQKLIAGAQTSSETTAVEAHVEHCATCQHRLDALAGVGAVGAVLVQAEASPRVESSSLLVAMEQLQLEATSLSNNLADGCTDVAVSTLLSGLTASARPGFIGKLGGIELRRVIGRGGMGVVFEGVDPELNRTVAVKVLSPHLLADEDARERFLREAQAAAALAHENVVAIHAIVRTAEGMPYLVLQHVAGESLAERLGREKKLSAEEVARIGSQVARGLAAAHARGLVHRDIKPANLLLARDTGRVLLTDFGLAKVAGGETITGVGAVAGTPAFMSPEQAAGEEVDFRSDLFSLGALLYVSVSGRLPFSGDSPFIVLQRIRADRPKPLGELDPTIPAWLCSVIHQLLEKDRGHRVQSAAEVAELLERRQGVTPQRSRRRWLVVTAFAALAVVAVTAYLFRSPPLRTTPTTGPTPQSRPRAAAIEIVGRPGSWSKLADALAEALDGSEILVNGNGPYPSSRIDIRGKRLTIRAAPGARPVFIPDSTTRTAQWLTSDSELTLDGLAAEWSGGTSDLASLPVRPDDGVVYSSGHLTLRRCRIASGAGLACVGSSGPTNVDECHLIGDKNRGVCVWSKATASLSVRRTALEARSAVVVAGGDKAAPIEFLDCTFQADTAVTLVISRAATAALPTNAQRCLFDTTHVVSLFYLPAYPVGERPTLDEMRATLMQSAAWEDKENVYRRNANYLDAWARSRPLIKGDLNSLANWHEFWEQTNTGSIEADLRFAPRPDNADRGPPKLIALDNPSGKVPEWAATPP